MLWHLWQQKSENPCTARIRVRVRGDCVYEFNINVYTASSVCNVLEVLKKKKPHFYSTFYQVTQKVASSQSILHKEVFIQHVVLKKRRVVL